MAPRSSSRSDGEVLTSDSEKATTSLPSRNGLKIDRPIRPSSASSRSPTRTSLRSRSRSRSPYRAPRGEKRRREDDRSRGAPPRRDPRTFNVRYEDDAINKANHQRSPHNDRDSSHPRRNHLNYGEDDGRQSHSKRPRTRSRSRSRSPYRRGRDEDVRRERRDGKRDLERTDAANDGKNAKSGHSHSMALSVSDRGKTYRGASSSQNHAKPLHEQALQNSAAFASSSRGDKYVRNGVDAATANETGRNLAAPDEAKATDEAPIGTLQITDEAAAIEERRKRREAIRNKYRSQDNPLLVQALHVSTESNSAASTPQPVDTPRRSVSPTASAPRTPKDTSAPQSPAELSLDQDEDIANSDVRPTLDDKEEASAADYDPTVDMQEERARHDKRLFKEDELSSLRADQKAVDQSANIPSPTGEQSPPKKSKGEFDMFADDDDDDDMFAEAPAASKATESGKAAQALDVNMMDDWDDPEGYYSTILGELIDNRYQVTQNLGRGMFSSVVRATDSITQKPVAIKIVRNNDTMRKAGIKEIDILRDIASQDPEDKKHVIRLHRSFDHKGHLCMVFESLSLNLREVLKKFGRDVGINLKAIRAYAQQLFLGLSLLKKCQYLHADLKPDNILVNGHRNMVKICDLGSAAPITENGTAQYLVSRFYRAPEIILGIPYDYAIDMWSIGCTLFELYSGKILFTGRNNNGMLRAIMECRGKFPQKLLRKGTFSHEYFDDLLNFQSVEQDKVTGKSVTKMIDISAKPVRDLRSRLVPKGKRMEEQERKEVELFLDLLDKCLDLRPEKRITPNEALKHPFISRPKA